MKENHNQKLLVEGNNDMHVVYKLRDKFNIENNFDVIDCKSISKIFPELSVRVDQADIQTIGLIIDADFDLIIQWNNCRKELQKIGYEVPEKPNLQGTIILSEILPKLGIWVMPNNQTKGMLEDFIQTLIDENDILLPRVRQFLDILEKENLNKYTVETKRSKAELHTWLALQKEPGQTMGNAMTQKYLTNFENSVCQSFIAWLIELFKQPLL
jgi:hypothetical protein